MMPLLTELETFFGCDFYKDVAPDGAWFVLGSMHCLASRHRCEFFWTNFFDGRKVKIVKRKTHAHPSSENSRDAGSAEINAAFAEA
jgi:hypothetical protein